MEEEYGAPFMFDTSAYRKAGYREILLSHFEYKSSKNWEKKLRKPDYTDRFILSQKGTPIKDVFCQEASCDTIDLTVSECEKADTNWKYTNRLCDEHGKLLLSERWGEYIRNTYTETGTPIEALYIFCGTETPCEVKRKNYIYSGNVLQEIIGYKGVLQQDWKNDRTDTVFTEAWRLKFFYIEGKLNEAIGTTDGNSQIQRILYYYSKAGLLAKIDFFELDQSKKLFLSFITTFQYR